MKDMISCADTRFRRTEFARQFCCCTGAAMILMGFYDPAKQLMSDSWTGCRDDQPSEVLRALGASAERLLTAWVARQDDDPDPPASVYQVEGAGLRIGIGQAVSGLLPVAVIRGAPDPSLPAERESLHFAVDYARRQLLEDKGSWDLVLSGVAETAIRVLAIRFIVTTPRGEVRFDSREIDRDAASGEDWLTRGGRLLSEGAPGSCDIHKALLLAASEQRNVILTLTIGEFDLRFVDIVPIAVGADQEPMLLLMVSEDADHHVMRERFFDAFGLSRAERAVAHEVLSGHSITEAASRRNLADATARSYLKQVFAKTGTHRQGELIARYFSSVLPLA